MLKRSMMALTAVAGLVSTQAAGQAVGQADVMIQSLTVVAAAPQPTVRGQLPGRPSRQPGGTTVPASLPASTALDIQVVVFSYNDDDAQNVKLNIFLPPETHAMSLPAGCVAPVTNNGATGVSNAFVTCSLGAMFVNASRSIGLTISRPPSFVVPRVGVFAWSETPDPNTANNHAEAVAP
jgi:hypothetical protein